MSKESFSGNKRQSDSFNFFIIEMLNILKDESVFRFFKKMIHVHDKDTDRFQNKKSNRQKKVEKLYPHPRAWY